MTIAQSLTISRADLSLSDLVIAQSLTDSFHLPEGGLAFPDFAMRLTYAPDSDEIPGKVLVGAVLDAGTLPVRIYAHSTTTTLLNTARRALEAAVSQHLYTVTIAVDGQSETYDAFPTWPLWGAVDSGLAKTHTCIATLTIPVNPA